MGVCSVCLGSGPLWEELCPLCDGDSCFGSCGDAEAEIETIPVATAAVRSLFCHRASVGSWLRPLPKLLPAPTSDACLPDVAQEASVSYRDCAELSGTYPRQDHQDGHRVDVTLQSHTTSEVMAARRNYEEFHGLPPGTSTGYEISNSSAGVQGWASALNIEGSELAQKRSSEQLHGLPDAPGTRSLSEWYLSDECQDSLDTQGVADELVAAWSRKEEEVLSRLRSEKVASSGALPPQVRDSIHRFISYIASNAGLPQKSFFEAAALFDIYIAQAESSTDEIPATCAALVILLLKQDSAIAGFSGAVFASHASQFANYMSSSGVVTRRAVEHVTEDMVYKKEKEILESLGWRIVLPTIESWITTFTARFNVLTHRRFMTSLEWLWHRAMFGARMLVRWQALSDEFPPKGLAVGLLGLGLVGARLIPLDAIQPHKISADEWKLLYSESQPQGPETQCMLPLPQSNMLLELLMVATGVDVDESKQYCHLAARAMRDCFCAASTHPNMVQQSSV